jgi:DNA-binding transcriptional MerR regulator
MMMIGELAKRTATKVPTIRFYEEIGLMRRSTRLANGRRTYGSDDLSRLTFIRHARSLGFEVAEIRSLLALGDEPDRSCAQVNEIAVRHLSDVEDKIMRLQRLRDELTRISGLCKGGLVAGCRVLEVLGDPALCGGDH